MRFLAVALLAITPIFGAYAQANQWKSDWKKQTVVSAEGMAISVDYQLNYTSYTSNKPSESYSLEPVIFNVVGGTLRADDTVSITFNNTIQNLGSCGLGNPYTWRQDTFVKLNRAPEGHFYGNLTADGVKRNGQAYSEKVGAIALVINPYCRTEVSIGQELVVNVTHADGSSTALVDPVSGAPKFKLDLEKEIATRYRQ